MRNQLNKLVNEIYKNKVIETIFYLQIAIIGFKSGIIKLNETRKSAPLKRGRPIRKQVDLDTFTVPKSYDTSGRSMPVSAVPARTKLILKTEKYCLDDFHNSDSKPKPLANADQSHLEMKEPTIIEPTDISVQFYRI